MPFPWCWPWPCAQPHCARRYRKSALLPTWEPGAISTLTRWEAGEQGSADRAAGEEGVDADDDPENLALQVVAQKPKTVDDRAVSIVGVPSQQPHPKPGMNRTSSLDAPIMLLEGHGDAVNSIKFSPDGATVASCGADKTVLMWNVRGDREVRARIPRFPPECARSKPYFVRPELTTSRPPHSCPQNYMMMQGHKNSVLELHRTADGDNILTCSPDKTLRLWDATTGESVKQDGAPILRQRVFGGAQGETAVRVGLRRRDRETVGLQAQG